MARAGGIVTIAGRPWSMLVLAHPYGSGGADMNLSTPGGGARVRRCNTTVAAFVLGLPLAAAVLGVLYGPLKDTPVFRYVEHRVECVEVVMFCCALGTLGAKLWQNLFE